MAIKVWLRLTRFQALLRHQSPIRNLRYVEPCALDLLTQFPKHLAYTCDVSIKHEKNKESNSSGDEDGEWRMMFMILETYRQKFGHLNVPAPKKSEKDSSQQGWYELYAWVKVQRKKHAKGNLRLDQMQKLSNLGLDLRLDRSIPLHAGADGINGTLSQQKNYKVGCLISFACHYFFSTHH